MAGVFGQVDNVGEVDPSEGFPRRSENKRHLVIFYASIISFNRFGLGHVISFIIENDIQSIFAVICSASIV